MWKPSSIFIAILLVADTFFLSYAVGLNSRHVLVVDYSLGKGSPPTTPAVTTLTTTTTSQTTAGTTAPPATTAASVALPGGKSFSDLGTTESRLQESLKSAAEAGILDPTQDQKFHPNDPVTRGDFTRWMYRVRQIEPYTPPTPTYSDVAADNPYFQDIEGATKAMMVQGYNVKGAVQKQFKPDQFICRQEFAVMYGTFSGKRGRAEKLTKDELEKYVRYNPSTSSFGSVTYKDIGDVDDWARKWIAVAHQAGLLEQAFDINPYDSAEEKKYLRPQQRMTRAEAVNILIKLYGLSTRKAVTQ